MSKQAAEQSRESPASKDDGDWSQREVDAAMTGTPDLNAAVTERPASDELSSNEVLQSLNFAAAGSAEKTAAEVAGEVPDAQSVEQSAQAGEIAPHVKMLADRLAQAIATTLSEFEKHRADEIEQSRQMVDRLGERLTQASFRFAKIERELKVLSDEIQVTRSDVESLRLEFDAADEDKGTTYVGAESVSELRSQVGTLAESVRATFQRLDEHEGVLHTIRKGPQRSQTSQFQISGSDADVSEHLL